MKIVFDYGRTKFFVKVFKVTFFKSRSEFEHMDPRPDPATHFFGIYTDPYMHYATLPRAKAMKLFFIYAT
jgi:hypothetical protein